MTTDLRFHELTFDAGFLFARHNATGEEVRFTRSERALLIAFTRNAGKVLSRGQLLDAISNVGSDATDRNIDFLINRLRGKLGDHARTPHYIGTRYGEGYVWIATPADAPQAAPAKALLVIGPVFGLERLDDPASGRIFLARLQAKLDAATAADQKIILKEGLRPGERPPFNARFALELSFFADAARRDCACVLREGGSRIILRADRLDLTPSVIEPAEWLADELRKTMWEKVSLPAGTLASPTDEPLEVRLHNAALMLARSPETWIEIHAQSARALQERPDDPEAALCVGMSIYSRLLQDSSAEHFAPEAAIHTEYEIERLVFASLPRIGGNPILMLAAAKLLLFSGRGHLELAQELAEAAFQDSTAFGSAFAVLGQISVCAGDIDAGLDLYERGMELAEPGSPFHIYLLVLACAAHLASGDREALGQAANRLFAIKPDALPNVGIFIAPAEEEQLPPPLRRLFESFDAKQARAVVVYLYYIFARLYRNEEHRENLMRNLISLTTRRFGTQVVPEHVWACVPRLRPVEARHQMAAASANP